MATSKIISHMRNKFLILLLTSIISLSGCSFVQLFEVTSNNLNNSGKYFEFENDSIRIIYDFNSNGGTFAFLIINKMKVPIYIDWRKSSFILNDAKNNYWTDITTSTTQGRNINISNNSLPNDIWSLSDIGLSKYTTISQTPERITFIPPSTAIPNDKFKIYRSSTYSFAKNQTFQKQTIDNNKSMKVEVESYVLDESPVRFRNFLTFSTTEKFDKEFYLDNSFYVNRVKQFKSNLLMKMISPKSFYIFNKSDSEKNKNGAYDPLYD
jgi:hypothetical protein